MDDITLRCLRLQLGLSQEALAHKLGVSVQSVHRWETGRRIPQDAVLAKLDQMVRKLDRESKEANKA